MHGNCPAAADRFLSVLPDKVSFRWTAEGFKRFISEHNFQIRQTAQLGGSLVPLCYWEANVQK